MRVLAVTTSTSAQGVCLRRPDAPDAIVRLDYKRGEPRQLTRAIWQLLEDAGYVPADLDLLVCDVGPGSFTGLRLGLATVRAMAWAAAVPAVGVGSLEAMLAETPAAAEGPWLAVLPSRRGVIYAGLGDAAGCWRTAEVALIDLGPWCLEGAQPLAAPVGLVGPAAALEAAAAALPGELIYRQRPGPTIEWICALGMAIADRGLQDPSAALQPRYLAVSEAERAARLLPAGAGPKSPPTP